MALKVVGSGLGTNGHPGVPANGFKYPWARTLPSHGRGVQPSRERALVDRGRKRPAGLGCHFHRLPRDGGLSRRPLLAPDRCPLPPKPRCCTLRSGIRINGSTRPRRRFSRQAATCPALVRLQNFFASFTGGFREHLHDRAYMTDHFRRHTEEVKRTIPAARLLIYEAGQGWEPLCRFFGVSIPGVPYPNENSRAEFIGLTRPAGTGGALTPK